MRYKRIIQPILILLFFSGALFASFDTKKGARPLGMGGTFVAVANTGDATYYNPAGLWQIGNPYAQAYYSAPFNLKDLGTTAFNFTYPWIFGNGTINFESYGSDLYRETTMGVAFSRSFREKLIYGVVLNYDHLNIKNAGSAGTIGCDMGLLFRPHEMVTLGFAARNINKPEIKNDALPQTFSMGASIRMIDPLILNVDVYKDIKFPTDVRFGAEYQFFDKLFLRVGMAREPSLFSAGLGFDFGKGVVDYAIYSHPDLGVTHAISASFHIKRLPARVLKSSYR
ncbi:hypothetical protein JNM05_00290 [bacterium]|nr:hypothetical protein [bacterium]